MCVRVFFFWFFIFAQINIHCKLSHKLFYLTELLINNDSIVCVFVLFLFEDLLISLASWFFICTKFTVISTAMQINILLLLFCLFFGLKHKKKIWRRNGWTLNTVPGIFNLFCLLFFYVLLFNLRWISGIFGSHFLDIYYCFIYQSEFYT